MMWIRKFMCGLLAVVTTTSLVFAQRRTESHTDYAAALWEFATRNDAYKGWATTSEVPEFTFGPPTGPADKTFMNRAAARAGDQKPHGSVLVTEHYAEDLDEPTAVTIRYRFQDGYYGPTDDWYWAQFTAKGRVIQTIADRQPFPKPGFVTIEEEGRLWVFRNGSPLLAHYVASGDLAKHVIRPGAGPAGKTVKAPDAETLHEYLTARDGFVTKFEDGRLWVFRTGAEELAAFERDGELAKHVIRPAAGPLGLTVKAPDVETLDAYLARKPGFVAEPRDGYLWVFREDSEALETFRAGDELAKHVTWPASGPGGMTLKSVDSETLAAYVATVEGFETRLDEGRVWVFLAGSEAAKAFDSQGEPAQQIIRPAAGPRGMTIKALDKGVAEAYLRAIEP
jgi:hypothetical protein